MALNDFGISSEVYDRMVLRYGELVEANYNAKGIRIMLEDMFQSVSLKKIKSFVDQMEADRAAYYDHLIDCGEFC